MVEAVPIAFGGDAGRVGVSTKAHYYFILFY